MDRRAGGQTAWAERRSGAEEGERRREEEGKRKRKEKEKGREKEKREREKERERKREGDRAAPITAGGRAWATGRRAAWEETAARKKREGTGGGKRWNDD